MYLCPWNQPKIIKDLRKLQHAEWRFPLKDIKPIKDLIERDRLLKPIEETNYDQILEWSAEQQFWKEGP